MDVGQSDRAKGTKSFCQRRASDRNCHDLVPLALSETKLADPSDPAHPKLIIILTLPSLTIFLFDRPPPSLPQAGTISVGDFHHVLQEVTNFPLRPFVLPFLKANIPLLARDVAALALRSPPAGGAGGAAGGGCRSPLEYLR